MAAVTKRGKRLLSTKRLRVGVDPGGAQAGAFQELVGAQSIAHEVGARSVEQVDFFGDTAAETGSRTVEPFTVGLGTLLDHMRVYRGLQAADQAGRPVRVRVDVYGYVLRPRGGALVETWEVAAPAANDAEASAKGGVVTIAGTGAAAVQQAVLADEIQIGDVIWYGDPGDMLTYADDIADDAFIINRIEYDDESPTDIANLAVYATAADGDNAAAKGAAIAEVRVAGYRKEFLADVEQQGSFSGDASGSPSLDGGMVFRPKTIITPRTLILFDQAGSGW